MFYSACLAVRWFFCAFILPHSRQYVKHLFEFFQQLCGLVRSYCYCLRFRTALLLCLYHSTYCLNCQYFFENIFQIWNTSSRTDVPKNNVFLLDIMILIIIYTGSELQNDILLQYENIWCYDILHLKHKIDANITLICAYLMVIVHCFLFVVVNYWMLYCVVFWYV